LKIRLEAMRAMVLRHKTPRLFNSDLISFSSLRAFVSSCEPKSRFKPETRVAQAGLGERP
ncbi:MAG: hypothetical protein NTX27_00740, partial [Verrucomicrobia bacterium]|nr:hypothetical protein [Verrucomicrobiota bacterium]